MFRQKVAKNHETDWSFFGKHVLQSHILLSACGVSDMFKVHESRSQEGDCALNSLEDNCFSQSFQLQPPVSKFRDEVFTASISEKEER